jgi:hypothetical protein
MAEAGYKISFTTGGLYYREAVKTVELYFKLNDWPLVRSEILSKNLLKTRTQSSLVRTTRELIQRLQGLTRDQLSILADGTRQEQNQILWLAVCRQYRFVREFAIEVMREKYLRLDLELSYRDFDAFFNAKAEWNDGLDQTKDSTRKKLRQVLFRILTEADLISPSDQILPMMISSKVVKAIADDDVNYFSVFPVSEADIRKYKKL